MNTGDGADYSPVWGWSSNGNVSLTYADGRLYGLDNDGTMLLVRVSPEGAAIVGRFPVPRSDTDHTLAHPVVCGGRLYLRHLDQLFVYEITD